MPSQETNELGIQAIKAAPAAAGSLAASLTLNQWVAVATAVYIIVQVAYLLRKWWREENDWARGKRGRKVRAAEKVIRDHDQ